MNIREKDVDHIASLARLELSENEKRLFQDQLSSILQYIDKLKEIDVKSIQPTSHVHEFNNVYRNDRCEMSLSSKEALKNAPDMIENFYKVLKIID